MTTSIFDGKSIDVHAVKFGGSAIEVDQARGAEIKQDDTVTLLVTGTIKKSTLDTTKEGPLRRTNTVSVIQARLLDDAEWSQVEVALAVGDGQDLYSLFDTDDTNDQPASSDDEDYD